MRRRILAGRPSGCFCFGLSMNPCASRFQLCPSFMVSGIVQGQKCIGRLCLGILILPLFVGEANAQQRYNWEQIKNKVLSPVTHCVCPR